MDTEIMKNMVVIKNLPSNMIEEAFDIRLPEDEAGFIALHIVNAQMDDNHNVILFYRGIL